MAPEDVVGMVKAEPSAGKANTIGVGNTRNGLIAKAGRARNREGGKRSVDRLQRQHVGTCNRSTFSGRYR